MTAPPKKATNHLGVVLDTLKVNKALTEAVELAKKDPAHGLGAAIGTGVVMQTFLNQLSSEKDLANSRSRLSLSFSSLDALRKPLDEISSQSTKESYASTISSLASVANLSKTLKFSTMPTLENDVFKRFKENEAIKWESINNTLAIDQFKKSISNYDSAAKFLKLGTYQTELQKLTSTIEDINKTNDQLNIKLRETSSIASMYLSSTRSLYLTESKLELLRNDSLSLGAKSLLTPTTSISISSIEKLHDSLSRMSLASSQAWQKISSSPTLIGNTAPALLKFPAIELYTTANLASVISSNSETNLEKDSEIEEVIDFQIKDLEKKLMALDHDLLDLYRGGVNAILSGGPDWQRHSMTSFRELLTQIMHKLSPDNEVIAEGGEVDEKGRPTRKARLRFIYAEMAKGEFQPFIEADIKAAIEIFNLLSGGHIKLSPRLPINKLSF